MEQEDTELEHLLGFDGIRYLFASGYWLKMEVKRVAESEERPHGLRYNFTLHDATGQRILGFDNAHGVSALGSRHKTNPVAHDHWHRTAEDPGRPYTFRSAYELIADFFAEVERVLGERGVGFGTARQVEKER